MACVPPCRRRRAGVPRGALAAVPAAGRHHAHALRPLRAAAHRQPRQLGHRRLRVTIALHYIILGVSK